MWIAMKEVVIATAGLFAVMAVWFAVQAFVRARSGRARDQDVLDHLKHGCVGCKGAGACKKPKTEKDHLEEKHHELA